MLGSRSLPEWPVPCSWTETEAAPAPPLAGPGDLSLVKGKTLLHFVISSTSNIILHEIMIIQSGNDESTSCVSFDWEDA